MRSMLLSLSVRVGGCGRCHGNASGGQYLKNFGAPSDSSHYYTSGQMSCTPIWLKVFHPSTSDSIHHNFFLVIVFGTYPVHSINIHLSHLSIVFFASSLCISPHEYRTNPITITIQLAHHHTHPIITLLRNSSTPSIVILFTPYAFAADHNQRGFSKVVCLLHEGSYCEGHPPTH